MAPRLFARISTSTVNDPPLRASSEPGRQVANEPGHAGESLSPEMEATIYAEVERRQDQFASDRPGRLEGFAPLTPRVDVDLQGSAS